MMIEPSYVERAFIYDTPCDCIQPEASSCAGQYNFLQSKQRTIDMNNNYTIMMHNDSRRAK